MELSYLEEVKEPTLLDLILLDKACEASGETANFKETLKGFYENRYQFFRVKNGEGLIVCYVDNLPSPRKPELFLWLFAGNHVMLKCRSLFSELKKIAQSQGCGSLGTAPVNEKLERIWLRAKPKKISTYYRMEIPDGIKK